MTKESGVSSNSVSLPQGGGDVLGLGGMFMADYNSGTGSYQLDIQTPTGHAKFSPKLKLVYNSGSSNGVFGLGWSLSVPKIQRNGERGFVQYNENDRFLLDEIGDLILLADGTYRPKIDRLFAKISRIGSDGWEIQQKEGIIQRFGIDESGQIFDPNHHSHILAWVLQESEDQNGNKISYKYHRDGNNLYLAEIAYAIYRILFYYEKRSDVYSTGRHGFQIITNLRCNSIEISSVA